MSDPVKTPRISVVIATYNRPESLRHLLTQLAAQTMESSDFEVVVVDDGSRTSLPEISVPYRLTVIRQENQGAAAARHHGAEAAVGDVVMFIDDDMEVPPAVLDAHARVHDRNPLAVVLGWIKTPAGSLMPLFERFHARYLDDLASDVHRGRRTLSGIDVWSGNLSLRRAQYLKVGGFDVTLGQSEDAELGLRLEKDGAAFHVSEEAHTIHHSDHMSLQAWMKRSYRYGRVDLRISRKHPEMRHANPWRYASIVTPVSFPFLGLAIAAPGPAHFVARAVMGVAACLDAMGLESAALSATDLAFGIEFTRGLHDEVGGLAAALREVRHYRKGRPPHDPRDDPQDNPKTAQRIGRIESS
ncbi:MAG: glycosyltransferase [Vicinamibacteria bacterium]